MAQTETELVEREVRIKAAPETIFSFFTDPEKVVRWHGLSATLDPRPGGVFQVEVLTSHTARGEFVEVEPPGRVVFTWGWDGGGPVPPGSSTVEITLTPDGEDTVVRLVHRGLPAEAVQRHGEGWSHYLPRLQQAAVGGDPGPDPWLSAGS